MAVSVKSAPNLLSLISAPEIPARRFPVARGMFLLESLKSMRATGSVAPSSRYLTEAMLAPVDFNRVTSVVELGCGTGAITREILNRLRPDGRLVAIDINRKFIRHLNTNSADRRLHAVEGDAAETRSLLAGFGLARVDAVISSLAFTCLKPKKREEILEEVHASLRPGGAMTQYQYVGRPVVGRFDGGRLLERYFGAVQVSLVLLNLPPALVFRCRK